MATDQKTSTLGIEPDVPGSVIENELPTYRAISNLAIFSVVCGLVAIFSWAHHFFYVAAILASCWACWLIERSGGIPTC